MRRWADMSPEEQAHERSEYEGKYEDVEPWRFGPEPQAYWDSIEDYDPDDHERRGHDEYTNNLRGGYTI